MQLAFILQDLQTHTQALDPQQLHQIERMAMGFAAVLPFLILLGLALVILPFWFICKKAGFSPWLSLLNIIPFGNIILIYLLAFSHWKVHPDHGAELGSGYPYAQTPPRI